MEEMEDVVCDCEIQKRDLKSRRQDQVHKVMHIHHAKTICSSFFLLTGYHPEILYCVNLLLAEEMRLRTCS